MAINKAKQAAAAVRKLVDRERELAQMIKAFKEEQTGIRDQMMHAMVRGDIDRVVTDTYQVARVQGIQVRLDKARLVEEGVSLKVIEAATKRTEYSYVKITERKEVA